MNKNAQEAYMILNQMLQELGETDAPLKEIFVRAQKELKFENKAVPVLIQKVHNSVSSCLLENKLVLSKKNRLLLAELMQLATKNGYKVGGPGSII
ncbi:hypothetical protein [Liquorilactobacillus uvarum]|uniref:hypothetical protein n=1 Tax=Liquorilactobacillus uvarum TaxID=303240 RepID=UPI00288A9381|nr:hypothetical protein [Liquorilactobacillus uvarum]